MDDVTIRAVIIGVNIFVTLTILTLLIVMFSQIQEIYGLVVEVDNSIYNKFDNVYSMYDGKIETGIGLINAVKRHEDNNEYSVIIKYPRCEELRAEINSHNLSNLPTNQKREATELKLLMEQNKTYKGEVFRYENKYTVTVTNGENETVIVEFIKIRLRGEM